MRHELYADSLDVVKWTAVSRAALRHSCERVLQVAMLRPDTGIGEGLKRFEPMDADATVQAFFVDERHRRDAGAVLRLADVVRLGGQLEQRLVIDIFADAFEHRTRVAYFRTLASALTATRVLVFIDPDTGINARGSDVHVAASEVVDVADRIQGRGVVLAYSHRGQYETVPKLKARVERELASAANDRTLSIGHHYANDGLVTAVRVVPGKVGTVVRKRQ